MPTIQSKGNQNMPTLQSKGNISSAHPRHKCKGHSEPFIAESMEGEGGSQKQQQQVRVGTGECFAK
jgi:hypothetical protein